MGGAMNMMTSNDEKQKIYIMAVEMGDNSEDC